jgi:hypothetical protein
MNVDFGKRLEQRAVDRRLLRVAGMVLFPGGVLHDVRTVDASPGGVGVQHERAFPPVGTHGRLRLQVLVESTPAVFESEIEVRFSAVAGHAFRTGLQFVATDPEQSRLLARVLQSRPLVFVGPAP